jgi:adenylate cyclase
MQSVFRAPTGPNSIARAPTPGPLPVHTPPVIPPTHAPFAPPPPAVSTNAQAVAAQQAAAQALRNVTIGGAMMESHVRSKIAAEMQQFLPERASPTSRCCAATTRSSASRTSSSARSAPSSTSTGCSRRSSSAASTCSAPTAGSILLFEEGELKARCSRARRPGPEELVVSKSVVGQVLKEKVAVLSSDAKLDPRFSESKSIIMTGIRSSMAVPLLHKGELIGDHDGRLAEPQRLRREGPAALHQHREPGRALHRQRRARAAHRAKRPSPARAFSACSRPPSPSSWSGKVEVKQGGEPRTTTMLFSDIRGFTSRSETMPAEEIVAMLNDYFERMVEIVFRYEGTLDKFVGDEIMALFGAPVSAPDDAVRAVRSALDMLDELRRFNTEREAAGKVSFEIGIGINTGDVVAGYIGSSKAMQYTVIGAPVNLAARLCSAAKGMQVLVSETTWVARARPLRGARARAHASPRASPSPCGSSKCCALD